MMLILAMHTMANAMKRKKKKKKESRNLNFERCSLTSQVLDLLLKNH